MRGLLGLATLLLVPGAASAQYRDYFGDSFKSEFTSPPAVADDERMRSLPPEGAYVAFSLGVAQESLSSLSGSSDYRKAMPEVFNLGGMTRVLGAVLDAAGGDLIVVGVRDSLRQPLTLDDLVVALRSRFLRGEWPLVSIDPDSSSPGSQHVRFEGGIERTQFGADMLAADYLLKLISFGIEAPTGLELDDGWDTLLERAKSYSSDFSIEERLWFYPILPAVAVRDGIAAIRDLKVGIFSEVRNAEIDGERVTDPAVLANLSSVRFASQMTDQFEKLALSYPSIARLRGLQEVTALARSLEELEIEPMLGYWLRDYRVRMVATPPSLQVVRRQFSDGQRRERRIALVGGVELTALAARLKGGDVTALRKAVLETRPHPRAQSWSFVVGGWVIPVERGSMDEVDASLLFAEFEYFLALNRWGEAVRCLDGIDRMTADFEQEVQLGRLRVGVASAMEKLLGSVSDWAKRALSEGFHPSIRFEGSGVNLGELEKAARTLLSGRRDLPDVHLQLGLIDILRADFSAAEGNLGRAIELDANNASRYYLRGLVRLAEEQREEGLRDLAKCQELDTPEGFHAPCKQAFLRARRNPDGQTWLVHRQQEDGFEFAYPADWDVYRARDPRVAEIFEGIGLSRDAALAMAKTVRSADRAAIIVNPYDSTVISVVIVDAARPVPAELVRNFWQASMSDTTAIERKNRFALDGFRVRTKGITDSGKGFRVDLTYDFEIRVGDLVVLGAGRRAVVYFNAAPSRLARVEYHSTRGIFEKRQSYVTKVLDTLRVWNQN